MKRMSPTKPILALSGLIALGIGWSVLAIPNSFYAMSEVILPDDVNLLNDLRAFGGGTFAIGVLICLGFLRSAFSQPALIIAAVTYSGFGLARMWAIFADGPPATSFLLVMVIELAVAIICAALALKTAPHGN